MSGNESEDPVERYLQTATPEEQKDLGRALLSANARISKERRLVPPLIGWDFETILRRAGAIESGRGSCAAAGII